MIIPKSFKKYIANKKFSFDDVGMSTSKVICFEDMVLKTNVAQDEINIMEWLDGKLPVPKIFEYEVIDSIGYLLMSKINGKMTCDSEYLNNSSMLLNLLSSALEQLWNIDIMDCPNIMTLDNKLRLAEFQVENNLCDIDDAEPDTYGKNGFKSPEELLKWLIDNKPNENLVLSHGDFCLPNILANNDKISGFVDLGRCGIADKYQDIALCYRSLKHNYEGKFSGRAIKGFNPDDLFISLGIQPDRELLNYYILLDELF